MASLARRIQRYLTRCAWRFTIAVDSSRGAAGGFDEHNPWQMSNQRSLDHPLLSLVGSAMQHQDADFDVCHELRG